MTKKALNISLTIIVVLAAIILGFTFWVRDRYVVPILTYHSVGPLEMASHLNTVSTESFRRQMEYLVKNGYNVISFDSLIEGMKKGYSFSRNTVVIQFDDGYEDNYKYAFPILKEHRLPAIVFVVSDKVGTPGFLTWDHLKEMEKSNFVAGAHTRRHAYLPGLKNDQALEEISLSKKIIEDHLGHKILYFSYPMGGFSPVNKNMVRDVGFQAAVTTNRGEDRFNHDFYALKRIRMNEKDNEYFGVILWAKLSGYYNLFRRNKSGNGPPSGEEVL